MNTGLTGAVEAMKRNGKRLPPARYAYWAYRRFVKGDHRAGHFLAEELTRLLSPGYLFSDYGLVWLDDEGFFDYYRRFYTEEFRSADRKFFLKNLLNLVEPRAGDMAECGAYTGASAWLLAERALADGETHVHLFDSFEGLSRPGEADGSFWSRGDLTASEEQLRQKLSTFASIVHVYKGWIPQRFHEVSDRTFTFVHIDVDLYQPTLDSLEFFYPRTVPGGILVSDDYGFSTCPGAKSAFDEFVADKPEKVVHVPTGQGFIVKR